MQEQIATIRLEPRELITTESESGGARNEDGGMRTEELVRKTKIDFPRFESGDPTEVI